MAQEAGVTAERVRDLINFAALVASAERERIKQANAPEIERINAHIKELEDAVKAEREKFCAVLRQLHDSYSLASDSNSIQTRG